MSIFDDVGDFHEKFDLPRSPADVSLNNQGHGLHRWLVETGMATPPSIDIPQELIDFRLKFLHEELKEIEEGYASGDLEQVADGLVDLIYVALGTAHLHRLPFDRLFDEVQRANMRKVRAASSSDSKRGSSYDVVKPEGWTKPNIIAILESHGWKPQKKD